MGSENTKWQLVTINKTLRSSIKNQVPKCIWITGLSGAGKSTIGDRLEVELHRIGKHTYVLDGDNLRHGLNENLGFTLSDRAENVRRVAEVAKLMVDAGLMVVVCLISPQAKERAFARSLFEADEFIEVFLDTPLIECERRDVKGLYAKARKGEIQNFTGIDSVYEVPKNPELHLYPHRQTVDECAISILNFCIN